jgi:cyclohexadienyl dehydratase
MPRLLSCLAVALVLTATSARAEQPSRLDDIIKRGSLRVGTTGDYPPFTYLDKATEKFRGLDIDIADALGKALGDRVELVQTAWPQLMRDFEADKFDIAMGGITITLDRQKKGLFSRRRRSCARARRRSRAALMPANTRRSPTSTSPARA